MSHPPHPPTTDMWNQRFSAEEYVYGDQPNDFLRETALQLLTDTSDITCFCEGEGRNAVWLATQGHRVSAIDISSVGLQKCLRLAAANHVEVHTVEADMTDHEAPLESADGVVMIFAHVPPQSRDNLLAQARRVLRPGGWVIFEGYTPEQIGRGTGGPPTPDMMFTAEGLIAAFDGFDILQAEERVRGVTEGHLHTGAAAVVQFTARKPL